MNDGNQWSKEQRFQGQIDGMMRSCEIVKERGRGRLKNLKEDVDAEEDAACNHGEQHRVPAAYRFWRLTIRLNDTRVL